MKTWPILFLILLFTACWLSTPALAGTGNATSCTKVTAKIEAQDTKLSVDLRRIYREIAALRADFNKPGMREIFGGLGYIAGLFGVAAFVASRRKD